jgi:hypothetical protein
MKIDSYISDDEEKSNMKNIDENYNSADKSDVTHAIYLARQEKKLKNNDYNSLKNDERYLRQQRVKTARRRNEKRKASKATSVSLRTYDDKRTRTT